jgi:hypothetical protein
MVWSDLLNCTPVSRRKAGFTTITPNAAKRFFEASKVVADIVGTFRYWIRLFDDISDARRLFFHIGLSKVGMDSTYLGGWMSLTLIYNLHDYSNH